MTPFFRLVARFFVVCGLIVSAQLAASAAWNEKVLYRFKNIPDGAVPVGQIVFDKAGNLYGATEWAGDKSCPGTTQCGIVYQLQPPTKKGKGWKETILYTFKGKNSNDGAGPQGGLLIDSAGNLYGTTGYGGAGNCVLLGGTVGCGTVFELSPPQQKGGAWTETVLYSFLGDKDGYVPHDDLAFDKRGNIYGATLFGGGYGNCNEFYGFCGTIFKLVKPKTKGGAWTEQVLHSFRGADANSLAGDGANPNGGLIFDSKGAIYGTTNAGGSSIEVCGTTAPLGCGTVFRLVQPKKEGGAWTEDTLHVFVGYPTDGTRSTAGMVFDNNGNLYGTTAGGGAHQCGVLFELMPHTRKDEFWKEAVLHNFSFGPDGWSPGAKPSPDPVGRLYGTASGGKLPFGVVFRLTPEQSGKWKFEVLYNFQGPPDGYFPSATLVFGKNGHAYSNTAAGGLDPPGGNGTVFEVWP
jgi:uncharacterized repeat protein (TIGR03803 family)